MVCSAAFPRAPPPELPPEPLPSPRRLELLHSTGTLREELRAAAQDLEDARSATRGSEVPLRGAVQSTSRELR